MTARLTPQEERIASFLKAARVDHRPYMERCLKIVGKDSQLVPLRLNAAQLLIHTALEQQLRDYKMVRAMILKGRKMGSSTYVGGRFYVKTRLWPYREAVVMAHTKDSAQKLFRMVQTQHREDPLRPQTVQSNAGQLAFVNNSSYTVATAGSGEAGRGGTPTLAHLSEAAFYPNPEKTFAGFAASIPLVDNSEIIVESTANGLGNEFHRRWVRAEAGLDDGDAAGVPYLAIFIPWFLDPLYRLPAPAGFRLDTEPEGDGLPSERDIAEQFGLDNDQMVWRRHNIRNEFGGSVTTFMQEYPNTSTEAFQTTGVDLFIAPLLVLKARKRRDIQAHGPRILGIDPAGLGGDKFCATLRQGHVVHWQKGRARLQPGEEQGLWIAALMDEYKVDRANVDYSGGWGTSLMGWMRDNRPDLADKLFPVDFGGQSQAKQAAPHRPGPRNRRAEMYMRGREWLELPEGVSIPDDDLLQGDLGAIAARITGQSTDTVLESKKDIKSRLGRSPDYADSWALTFAVPDRVIQTTLTDSRISATDSFNEGATVQPKAPRQPPPDVQFGWTTGGGYDSGGSWMG